MYANKHGFAIGIEANKRLSFEINDGSTNELKVESNGADSKQLPSEIERLFFTVFPYLYLKTIKKFYPGLIRHRYLRH